MPPRWHMPSRCRFTASTCFLSRPRKKRCAGRKGGPKSDAASCNVIYNSEISHAIVDYAKDHKAAFIVLGVRHGPVLSSHLPPYLTYRMIATAPCPVLTVSPEAARRTSGSAASVNMEL